MGTVVVLGSLIVDLVAQAPRMPLAGESLVGLDFNTFLGGKGINQAITAARLGSRVTMIGRVGSDTFGDGFFPTLKDEGIESTYVERDEQVGTGVSLVVIAADSGQNMIVANPRANWQVPGLSVEKALQAVREQLVHAPLPDDRPVFLTQCETSTVSYVTGLQQARELGMLTILNAAPVPREPLSDEVFRLIDVLIVNEVEAAALSEVQVNSNEAAQQAAEVLLRRGPQQVIITLGAQGALWSSIASNDGLVPVHQLIPAFKVKAIDATAAGDTFCGALAAGLADGMPIAQALRRASAAGAITASRMGAIAALPTAQDVDTLLAQ